MDFFEFVGFIISLAAFVFLMFRRRTRPQTNNEVNEELEQQQRLKDFLRSLDIDVPEEPVRQPPPPLKPKKPKQEQKPQAKPLASYQFESDLDDYKQQPTIASRKFASPKFEGTSVLSKRYQETANDYHVLIKEKPSQAKRLIHSLRSPKDMIIINEILNRYHSNG